MSPETTEASRAAVQRLQEEWDWPDPALLREIVAHGEAAIAPLTELLTPEVIRMCKSDDYSNSIVYYVIRLLAEPHSPAAIPTLIGLYADLDDAEDYSDDLIETLPEAMLTLGTPEAIGPLLTVMTDERLSWYPRSSAVESAVNLAGTDPALRAQIAETLRPLLADRVHRAAPISITPQRQLLRDRDWMHPFNDDDSDMVAELVGALADVNDLQARPLIESAYRAGLVNTKIIGLDDVNEIYATGGETHFRTAEPWLEQYEENYQEHQQEDRETEGDSEAAQRLRQLERAIEEDWEPVQAPVVLGKRLGRNDPCWCGSGKKYKKCHLAEDEKDGRA